MGLIYHPLSSPWNLTFIFNTTICFSMIKISISPLQLLGTQSRHWILTGWLNPSEKEKLMLVIAKNLC